MPEQTVITSTYIVVHQAPLVGGYIQVFEWHSFFHGHTQHPAMLLISLYDSTQKDVFDQAMNQLYLKYHEDFAGLPFRTPDSNTEAIFMFAGDVSADPYNLLLEYAEVVNNLLKQK